MRTFFPRQKDTVDASSHCEGAEYLIGIGSEMWVDGPAHVLKIQMAYGGQVAGRKAPSFPLEQTTRDGHTFRSCPDFDEVVATVEKMIGPLRRWLITWDRPPGGSDVSDLVSEAIKQAYDLNDEDLLRPCLQVRTVEIQASETADKVATRIRGKLRKLGAPQGITIYAARVADESRVNV
jgi:hypothetical protein